MFMVNNKISLALILSLLFGSTLTNANESSTVRVSGPDGFKIYSFQNHNLDEGEIVKLHHKGMAKGVKFLTA